MKIFSSRIAWGLLLIVGGLLFLLENLNILSLSGLFWAILFAMAGVAFISTFLADRSAWWALIPGVIFLSLGGMLGMSVLAPRLADLWGGAFFLGGISLAFWLVYLADRRNWWAIIPAGVLATVALIAGLGEAAPGMELGGLFFLGIGLTFALVGVLPNTGTNMRWAFIPAGIMIVLGLLITAASVNLINYIWPALLILAGLFLLLRTYIYRRG
jgi:hypothetical protein